MVDDGGLTFEDTLARIDPRGRKRLTAEFSRVRYHVFARAADSEWWIYVAAIHRRPVAVAGGGGAGRIRACRRGGDCRDRSRPWLASGEGDTSAERTETRSSGERRTLSGPRVGGRSALANAAGFQFRTPSSAFRV
jgi:hypothetical protein